MPKRKRKRDAGYEPLPTKLVKERGEEPHYPNRKRRRERIKQLAAEAPDGLRVDWPTMTVTLRRP